MKGQAKPGEPKTIKYVRRELRRYNRLREDGELTGPFTRREIALVAQLDRWNQRPKVKKEYDRFGDTAALFGNPPSGFIPCKAVQFVKNRGKVVGVRIRK